MSLKNTSVIILAGGNSGRMGQPKLFLPFDAKRNFIRKIIDEYLLFGISKIILVIQGNLKDRFKLEFPEHMTPFLSLVVNDFPDRGRLFSLTLGLQNLGEETTQCFIQNADNPFVSSELLHQLFDQRSNEGYTSPCYHGKGGHPILLSKRVMDDLANALQHDNETGMHHTLKDLLATCPRIKVECSSDVLINVNTPAEYQKIMQPMKSVRKE